jgi:hypothetical protein
MTRSTTRIASRNFMPALPKYQVRGGTHTSS